MKNKIIFPSILIAIMLGVMVLSNLNIGNSSNSIVESTDVTSAEIVYMYLSMAGSRQGDIEGSVTTVDHEGSIEVYAYTHSIISPRDPTTGLVTGKHQHKPFTVIKPIDKATPLLYSALSTSETIKEWKLDFYRTTSTGTVENFYTIELTNAVISEISDKGSSYGTTQSVSFVYQKISWTWTDGNIMAEDYWKDPSV